MKKFKNFKFNKKKKKKRRRQLKKMKKFILVLVLAKLTLAYPVFNSTDMTVVTELTPQLLSTTKEIQHTSDKSTQSLSLTSNYSTNSEFMVTNKSMIDTINTTKANLGANTTQMMTSKTLAYVQNTTIEYYTSSTNRHNNFSNQSTLASKPSDSTISESNTTTSFKTNPTSPSNESIIITTNETVRTTISNKLAELVTTFNRVASSTGSTGILASTLDYNATNKWITLKPLTSSWLNSTNSQNEASTIESTKKTSYEVTTAKEIFTTHKKEEETTTEAHTTATTTAAGVWLHQVFTKQEVETITKLLRKLTDWLDKL